MQEFFSHGKLLITGEYVIMDGAIGLAVPTHKGQSLKVTVADGPYLVWKSFDHKGHCWFEERFDPRTLEPEQKESPISMMLAKTLSSAKELNPGFLASHDGYLVESFLDFPRDWGLGSSSTLINNIANWAQIDAYVLLERTFGGSGYDIACAQAGRPLTYQLIKDPVNGTVIERQIDEVSFAPSFSDALYFVHLNRKQDSREGISRYLKQKGLDKTILHDISKVTTEILDCATLDSFDRSIDRHEQIISNCIGYPTVKDSHFKDFKGSVKSLGAWGGDFVLATAKKDPSDYFKSKGFTTIIAYDDMVIK